MNEEPGIESGDWLEVIKPRSLPVFTAACIAFCLGCLLSPFVSFMTVNWEVVSMMLGTPACGLISGVLAQQRSEPWPWVRRLAIGFCSVWLFVEGFFLLAMTMG